MSLPVVAIIGRTNVGKSSLFNRLVKQRRAVVQDEPGVTRDRLYAEVEVAGRSLLLIDTGGLVGAENDALIAQVREHAAAALAEADLLLVMFDGQEGLTALDYEVAEAARRSGKPVLAVANKMESGRGDLTQFAELGFGLPLGVSALHNDGLPELAQQMAAHLPEEREEPEPELPANRASLTIIGRPNAGKSALANALLGAPRMIVSEIPGTTRDAVDALLEYEGRSYQLVDTPGLRRRGKRSSGTEYYSSLRTLRALARAEIGVLVFDSSEGFTQQDAAIALEVHNSGRALLLVANKWDLVHEKAFADSELRGRELDKADQILRKDFEDHVRSRLKFASHAPLIFTAALDGEGVAALLPLARRLHDQFNWRAETGKLNRVLNEAMAKHPPPSRGAVQLRLLYITQAQTAPPTFVLFVNNPDLMHFSYERFLLNFFRERFGLTMVPLVLHLRRRSRREAAG